MPGVAPGDDHRSLRGYAFFNRATIIHFPLIRSTAAGEWAQYSVSFGTSSGGPIVEETTETTAPRLAA